MRSSDASALVVINQLTPINVTFGIPEGQLPDLKRYLAKGLVKVEAVPPNETAPSTGRISFIDNGVDPDDRHDQDQGIVSQRGSTAVARSIRQRRRQADERSRFGRHPDSRGAGGARTAPRNVFVVKDDKTELSFVRSSSTAPTGDDVLIKNGLKAGETVVTDGQLRLVAGSRVAVKTDKAAS